MMVFVTMSLEIGVWRLEIGVWSLEIGDWRLEIGDWCLEIETMICKNLHDTPAILLFIPTLHTN